MKTISPEGSRRHARFLAAHRSHVASEAELVFALVDVDREKVFLELGYASVADYALQEVGFEPGMTKALLWLGRSLGSLPVLREAFVSGLIDRSKLREIARVASPSTEASWLPIAQTSSYREIEGLAARTSKGAPPGVLVEGENVRDVLRRPSFLLREDVVVALEAKIEALRGDGDLRLDPSQAVMKALVLMEMGERKLGEEALEGKTEKRPRTAFDPRHVPWLLFIGCRSCKKTTLQTRTGEVEVSDSVKERLCEGAFVIDGDALVKEAEAFYAAKVEVPRGTPTWREKREPVPVGVERAVLARARFRCEVPGCTNRRFLQVGHIRNWWKVPDAMSNFCCLCWSHNKAEREGRIRLVGPYERLRVEFPRGRAEAG